MKNFRHFFGGICILLILIFMVANVCLINLNQKNTERSYVVEISRLVYDMEEKGNGYDDLSYVLDLNNCIYVKRVSLCKNDEELTANTKYDYQIRQVCGKLYRFEYECKEDGNFKTVIFVDAILICMSLLIIAVLAHIHKQIIIPFQKLEEIPYELSKGNLTLPLDENKTKYFGKFIWGINMLREKLEERRQNELNMHKDKKILLLSLTHDIKTPLSVIKLNAQALQKGLYKEETKQREAVESISKKVDEIENYVSEITAASRDDFLDFNVIEEEFYLSDVIDKIKEYYEVKLTLNKTGFDIEPYSNCILLGDEHRILEVLQNLMENAIKYGDGEKISITVGREEGCCLITIKNTGANLKPDELSKVFDSFYRGSNVGNQSGNGLGLYICRQLMNNMNGDIFVKEDEHIFSVTLVVRMCGTV